MTATLVIALFIVSLVLPPVAVIVGFVSLLWPGGRRRSTAMKAAHAHAH